MRMGRPKVKVSWARVKKLLAAFTMGETAKILGIHRNTLTIRLAEHRALSQALTAQRRRTTTRVCSDCHEEKPISAFSVRNREKGYRASYCKPCNSKRTVESNRRNSSRARERQRAYRTANPEKIKRYNQRGGARYRATHPDYHKQYHARHREHRNQSCRDWHKRQQAFHSEKTLNSLTQEVELLVSQRHLPVEIRDEVCQEVMLALLTGEVQTSKLPQVVSRYVRRVLKDSPLNSGTLSLDAPLNQETNTTFGEMVV